MHPAQVCIRRMQRAAAYTAMAVKEGAGMQHHMLLHIHRRSSCLVLTCSVWPPSIAPRNSPSGFRAKRACASAPWEQHRAERGTAQRSMRFVSTAHSSMAQDVLGQCSANGAKVQGSTHQKGCVCDCSGVLWASPAHNCSSHGWCAAWFAVRHALQRHVPSLRQATDLADVACCCAACTRCLRHTAHLSTKACSCRCLP